MICLINGDIFESECDVIVCPVNCVHVMGAGLALEFKKRFPEYYRSYINFGEMHIGDIHFYYEMSINKILVSLPTKNHWRAPSRYEYVRRGVSSLSAYAKANCWHSIAIPALGCGLGELQFETVCDIIKKQFAGFSGLIEIYEPK